MIDFIVTDQIIDLDQTFFRKTLHLCVRLTVQNVNDLLSQSLTIGIEDIDKFFPRTEWTIDNNFMCRLRAENNWHELSSIFAYDVPGNSQQMTFIVEEWESVPEETEQIHVSTLDGQTQG